MALEASEVELPGGRVEEEDFGEMFGLIHRKQATGRTGRRQVRLGTPDIRGLAGRISEGTAPSARRRHLVCEKPEIVSRTLIYELLDAHSDAVALASRLESDERWALHLDDLRALQRSSWRGLATMEGEPDVQLDHLLGRARRASSWGRRGNADGQASWRAREHGTGAIRAASNRRAARVLAPIARQTDGYGSRQGRHPRRPGG